MNSVQNHPAPDPVRGVLLAGRILDRTLRAVRESAIPGSTVGHLDALARHHIAQAGGIPALLGYLDPLAVAPFPAAISLAINSQIAGSWEPPRALCPGDLVTADLAVRLGDWHADAAVSWTVPGPTPSDRARLAVASRQVTRAALEACAPGQPWAEVVRAIHAAAAAEAVHLLPGFFAHGIGRALHQPPSLPLHRRDLHRLDHPGLTLERGMIITLEPVVSLARTVRVREGWLDRTADGSDACYTEVTAVIGRRKARVLAGKILMPDRT